MTKSQSRSATTLARAIETVRGSTSPAPTIQEIAKQAGVSTATITAILAGRFGPKQNNPPLTGKQVQGWMEAITRLCLFLNESGPGVEMLRPEDLAVEYGLGPDEPRMASLQHVLSDAINRVRERHAERGQTDVVLKAIAARNHRVRAGYLRWPPFVGEGGDAVRDSWARSHTRRMVAALNPISWGWDEDVVFESIDSAISAAATERNPCDLVFGLYDTPYRRLSGLDFLHLPGLGVRIGAVVVSDILDEARPEWPQIFRVPPLTIQHKLRLFVLKHEVGHLFLLGPCQYGQHEVRALEATGSRRIATELLKESMRSPGHSIVLVSDAFTSLRVLRELQDAESWIFEQKLAWMRDGSDVLQRAHAAFELEEDSESRLPVYRIGWALNAAATRWSELLRTAHREELFRNALTWTAHEYAELFCLPGSERISLLPLEPDLPPAIANAFCTAFSTVIDAPAFKGRIIRGGDLRPRDNWLPQALGGHQGATIK